MLDEPATARPVPDEGGPEGGPIAEPEAPARTEDIALVFGAPPRDLFGRVIPACVVASVQPFLNLLSLPGTPTDFGGDRPPQTRKLIFKLLQNTLNSLNNFQKLNYDP